MNKLILDCELLSSTIDAYRSFLATHRLSLEEISIYANAILAFLSDLSLSESFTLEESAQLTGFKGPVTAWELWREFVALQVSGHGVKNLAKKTAGSSSYRPDLSRKELLTRFHLALEQENRSKSTIKNYSADLRAFFDSFGSNDQIDFLTKPNTLKYLEGLKGQLSDSTRERKTTTLRQFFAWAKRRGYLNDNPLELPEIRSTAITSIPGTMSQETRSNALFSQVKNKLTGAINRYQRLRFASYLNLALMVIFISLLTFGAYKQFVLNVNLSQAFPLALTRPNRILSFQARLTNTAGVPLTGSTGMSFRLYDSSSGGTGLWFGSCSVSPDQDGIFSTLLGSTCGGEIDSSVFSENSEVWLEVQVESETLSPRQRIATVAYALNSETLQGYPPADPATVNSIPVVNATGSIIIGAASPTLQSTTGTFAVKANALTISTNTGTGGNITLAPDGTGQVQVLGGTTTTDTFTLTNANLSSGSLIKGTVGNNNTGYKFVSFLGGSSPAEKFSVDASGNVVAVGTYTGKGAILTATGTSDTPLKVNGTGGNVLSVANAGDITLATGMKFKPNSDSTTAINIANNAGTTFVTFDTSNKLVSISSLGTAGGIVYATNSSGTMGVSAVGTSGQCLISGGTGTPTWTSCSAVAGNYWQLDSTSTVISPGITSRDLAIGGTATATAKFQIFANSGNATTSGNLTFAGTAATNLIAAQNMAGLTIGNANTGNINFSSAVIVNDSLRITSFTSNGGPLYTNGSGVVAQTTAGTTTQVLHGGTTPSFSALDLAADVTGVLPIANGGTNNSSVYTSGSVIFSNGTSLTQNNAQFFWDNTNYRLGLGTAAPNSKLDLQGGYLNVSGGATFSATYAGSTPLVVNGNASIVGTLTGLTGLTSSGDITFSGLNTAGAVVWTDTNGKLGVSAAGSAGQCLISGGAGTPIWTSCSIAANNYWQLDATTTVLSPGNASWWDLAVGGTATSSAKFQVFANSGNATTSGNLTFSGTAATNLIAAQNMAGLTIGDANTGNIIFNAENVGIGTAYPLASLHVAGTYGSNAALIVDQLNSGNILAASAAGNTRFIVTSAGDARLTGVAPALEFDETDTTNQNWQLQLEAGDLLFRTNNDAFSGASTKVTFQNTTGNVGIGTTSPNSKLDLQGGYLNVSGGATFSATYAGSTPLVVNGNASIVGTLTGLTGLTSAGTITFSGLNTAGGVIYAQTGGILGVTAQGSTNQCLISQGSGTPTWGTCATGVVSAGYWQLDSTVLSPGNSSFDLALGGTATGSALFFVSGTSGNASTSGNLTFSGTAATNLIAAQNMAGLTIGDGNTGNINFNPNGNIGIKNTTPTATLDVTGTASVSSTLTMGGAIQPANGPLTFNYKSGTNSWSSGITINTLGYVGIKTATPAAPLVLNGLRPLYFYPDNVGGDGYGTRFYGSSGGWVTGYGYRGSAGTFLGEYGMFGADDASTRFYIGTWSTGEKMSILTSSGNVGIANTNPLEKLDVVGNATISGNLTFTGAASTIASRNMLKLTIGDTQTGVVQISPKGATGIYVNGVGNVGIQMTSPVYALDVSAASSTTHFVNIDSSAAGGQRFGFLLGAGVYGSVTHDAASAAGLRISGANSGPIYIGRNTLLPIATQVFTPEMTFDTAGNVGIGTITPRSLLDIQGGYLNVSGGATFSATYAGGLALALSGNASTSGNLTFSGTAATNLIAAQNMAGLTIGDANTGNIIFSGGNVGIGTTNPDAKLEINGGGADVLAHIASDADTFDARLALTEQDNYGMYFEYDGSTNIGYMGMANNVAPNGAWSKRIQMSRNGSEVAFMAGNVGIGTSSPGSKLDIQGGYLNVSGGATFSATYAGGLALALSGNASTSGNLTFSGTAATNLIAAQNMAGLTIGDANTGNILFMGGKVGIGLTTPRGVFDVYDNSGTAKAWSYIQGNTGGGALSAEYTIGMAIGWNKSNAEGETNLVFGTGLGSAPRLEIGEWNGSAYAADMVVKSGGNVGIGNVDPSTRLYVRSAGASGSEVALSLDNPNTSAYSTTRINMITNGAVRSSIGSYQDNVGLGGFLSLETYDSAGVWHANLTVDPSGGVTIPSLNTAGAVVWTDTNGKLGITAQGTSGYCLVSGGSGTPGWAYCPAAANSYWQLDGTSTVLSPGNSTWSLALGNTASASATIFLDANTGYITGQRFSDTANSNYYIDPASATTALALLGNAGIGTTDPQGRLQVTNTGVAAIGKALVTLDQYENQNILTASASGVPRFAVDNSGNIRLSSSAPAVQFDESDTINTNYQIQIDGGSLLFRVNNDLFSGASTRMTLTNAGNLSISGVYAGASGTNTRLQATGTTPGSTGDSSIYFLNSSGTTAGRYDTLGRFGSGADGTLTITQASNCQTGTGDFGGSTKCIATYITAAASPGDASVTVNSVTGYTVGDEVMLIQMIGTGAGNYETHFIDSIDSTNKILYFAESLTKTYQATNAQVVRIPQFTTVTVQNGGTLTVSAWDPTTAKTGGVLFFRATSVTVDSGGVIDLNGLGAVGGAQQASVGSAGAAGTAACNNTCGNGGVGGNGTAGNAGSGPGSGGGGGATNTRGTATACTSGSTAPGGGGGGSGGGGAGGAYATATTGTAGTTGGNGGADGATGGGGGSGGAGGTAGSTNGDSTLTVIPPGSGGGSGASGGGGSGGAAAGTGSGSLTAATGAAGGTGGAGGAGGGITIIAAATLVNNGTIRANGANGSNGGNGSTGGSTGTGGCATFNERGGGGGGGSGGGGGGGSGGVVWFMSNSLTAGTVTVAGGTGGTAGTAGVGGNSSGSSSAGGGGGGGAVGGAGGTGNPNGGATASSSPDSSGATGGTGRTLNTTTNNYGTLHAGGVDLVNADLAEYYVSGDRSIEAGDVVAISDTKVLDDGQQEVTTKGVLRKADIPYSEKIIGVISTNPGVSLGGSDEASRSADSRQLALSGRVPVKIDPYSPPIVVGDSLTASNRAGYARKATEAGYVIGKALEAWTPGSGVDRIDVFVDLGFSEPEIYLAENTKIEQLFALASASATPDSSSSATLAFTITNILGEAINRGIAISQAMIANLTAGAIQARQIATDTLTVGGQRLEELIAQIVDQKLQSPLASGSASLVENLRHPDGSENLMIRLGSPLSPSSGINTLTIADRYANPVATIDELGNATFSGILTAKAATFEHLTLNDASISGVLYANQIEGLQAKVVSIVAANIHSSPVATTPGELVASLTDSNSDVLARIAQLESQTATTSGELLASSSFDAITIGSTLILDSTGINSAADVLAIQSNGQGTLDLLAGAVRLDSNGLIVNTDAYFARSVTVREDLMVNVIKSLNGDIAIHLATSSGDLSDRLAIMNNQVQEVASIDASGSAKFNKLLIASDRQDPAATATISGQYRTNASTGQAQLEAGANSLRIFSPRITSDSLIYVTPTSSTNNEVLYVSVKHVTDTLITNDSSYFDVRMDNPLAVPVTFNWWIIN